MDLTGFINNSVQNKPSLGAISTAIDNNINDKPNYGAVGQAIDDYVKSGNNNGFNWGTFGKNLLRNSQNISFGGDTQMPQVNFQPTMMQPQFVNTNFQNQASNIAQNNLYNALMR